MPSRIERIFEALKRSDANNESLPETPVVMHMQDDNQNNLSTYETTPMVMHMQEDNQEELSIYEIDQETSVVMHMQEDSQKQLSPYGVTPMVIHNQKDNRKEVSIYEVDQETSVLMHMQEDNQKELSTDELLPVVMHIQEDNRKEFSTYEISPVFMHMQENNQKQLSTYEINQETPGAMHILENNQKQLRKYETTSVVMHIQRDNQKELSTYEINQDLMSGTKKVKVEKKKEYCLFCDCLKTQLARHFVSCHKEETRVRNFMYLPLKSAERREKINILRKEGQYINNTKKDPEMIMAMRRSKQNENSLKDLIMCPYCKGFYRKLRSHIATCKPEMKGSHSNITLSRKMTMKIHSAATERVLDLYSHLRPGDVADVIAHDELIIRCANRWASRYPNMKDDSMLRSRMRLLGRFLLAYRKISRLSNCSFADIFQPQTSNIVIEAINDVAALNKTDCYDHPNTARDLGMLLKKCCAIYKFILISNQDQSKKEELQDFCVLLEQNLADSINRTVMENVSKIKRQKNIELPSEQDILKLQKFVSDKAADYLDRLSCNHTLLNYIELASSVLISLITFNRRRPGETERLYATDYLAGRKTYVSKDKTEFTLINIRGKKMRTVKLYVNGFLKKCIDTLLKYRLGIGISDDNPYIFGVSGVDGKPKYLRACPYFVKYSVECGAERPELLRATLLRKQVATEAAKLGLNDAEVGDLADFMGHAEKIHREHYRIPEGTREGNVLELLNKDRSLLKISNKNHLGEDDSHNDFHHKENPMYVKEGQDTENLDEIDIEEIPIKRKRTAWTEEEKNALESNFSKCIESQTSPTLQDCALIKKKMGTKKPVQAIKAFVNNTIAASKRKSFPRLVWSNEEKLTVKKKFADKIKQRKIPSESEAALFLEENSAVMKNRSPLSVKLWVSNYLNKSKSKSF